MRPRKIKSRGRQKPPLRISEILAWSDTYYRRLGRWPTADSGEIRESPSDTWSAISAALRNGSRGLHGGSSLARLLAKYRGRRNHLALPPLTVDQILAWADAYHQRTGQWPRYDSGPIPGSGGETWSRIESAYWAGARGLSKSQSLARLLAQHRGVRYRLDVGLTVPQILAWADAHFRQFGRWPVISSGKITESPGDTWAAVNAALWGGGRGLPGGCSLARLLAERRGVRNILALPRLTVDQILAWADAYHQRTGAWPNANSGLIPESDGQTWAGVVTAIRLGHRGLKPGSTLVQLLARHRGKRNIRALPPLSIKQILSWADAYHQRTGKWPNQSSGSIPGTAGENWLAVHRALVNGKRGLDTVHSLAELLVCYRGKPVALPLQVPQILAWADAHHARTGRWPASNSGKIPESPSENWNNLDVALRTGGRGLPSGLSVARLLAAHRGVRGKFGRPPLTIQRILAWADAHKSRTGKWPTRQSGKILEAPDESWSNVSAALTQGQRGLRPGSSLARLLAEYRGRRNHLALPRLTVEQVLVWADAYRKRTGKWPGYQSGPIPESDNETWRHVDSALWQGNRGLPKCSLSRLLAKHRGIRYHLGEPRLTIPQILAWADDHCRRTGKWPQARSGAIAQAPGETWAAVSHALRRGSRGLPGSSTLAYLRQRFRGQQIPAPHPPLHIPQILAWADAHRQGTGRWPRASSGPIAGTRGETWNAVNGALRDGRRGLPGGSSLVRVLLQHRGSRSRPRAERFALRPPPERPLTTSQILLWADAHRKRTGKWPVHKSGPIPESPGDTWARIDGTLQGGYRGLHPGDSLAKLLIRFRGVRRGKSKCRLTPELILKWAEAHRRRTGKWPTRSSGVIPESPGDRWASISGALQQGSRGLPPGSSLRRLIAQGCGAWSGRPRSRFSAAQILVWADAHRRRTGRFPLPSSGRIPESPGDEWSDIDDALRAGRRELPGKQGLTGFLAAHGRRDGTSPVRSPEARRRPPVRHPRPGRER